MTTAQQTQFRLEDHPPYGEAMRTLEALRTKRAAADADRQRLASEASAAEEAAINAEIAEIAGEAKADSARPARVKAEEIARKATAAQIYVERLDHAIAKQEANAAEQRKAAMERSRQIIRAAHEKIVARLAKALRELAAVELEERAFREASRVSLDGQLGNIYPPDLLLDGDERDPNSRLSLWLRQMRQQSYDV